MVMKYVILSDSDNIEPFIQPRQLVKVNGETLIERTIRLLKENGVKDILITSHDKRFDNLGAIRYEPLYNDYKPKEGKGYWLSAFPKELITEPITFLFGDVYYSENAIKRIVECKTDSVMYLCSYKNTDRRYIKHHDEPFAFKVVDCDLFLKHVEILKKMKDKGLTKREPIAWELYRSINGISIYEHKMTNNYIAINDETCDVDRVEDVALLQIKLGGDSMIKVQVIEDFTLEKFAELKNIVRANENKNAEKHLYKDDVFECNKDMVKYLTTDNKLKRAFVKVIEVIPEKAVVPEKKIEEKKTTKKTTTTSRKSIAKK